MAEAQPLDIEMGSPETWFTASDAEEVTSPPPETWSTASDAEEVTSPPPETESSSETEGMRSRRGEGSPLPFSMSSPEIQTESEVREARLAFLSGYQHNYYRPLYEAAIRGDWESAKSFIDDVSTALTARFPAQADSLLIVAIRACQWEFALKLVEILPPEALGMQNVQGHTALHFAAMGGNLRTVKALVKKNSALPQIASKAGYTPLVDSLAIKQCKELVWYLCLVTRDEDPSNVFTGPSSAYLVCYLAATGLLDILFYLLQRYPSLALVKHPKRPSMHLLYWLSTTPSNFMSGNKLKFWERWIYKFVHVEVEDVPPQSVIADVVDSLENTEGIADMLLSKVSQRLRTSLWKAIEKRVPCIKKVVEVKSKHNYAVELTKHVCEKVSKMNYQQVQEFFSKTAKRSRFVRFGTIEVVEICLQYFPGFIDLRIGKHNYLFQAAIQHRREDICNLLLNKMPLAIQYHSIYVNPPSKRTLHVAAKETHSTEITSIPGAALQMQKELQWFKAVEKLFMPQWVEEMNDHGQTPWEVFKAEHWHLAKEGEKWVKKTSTSSMLVTTLIATVAFAAIFTLPGGNANDKGDPIFLRRNSFVLFVVSDSLALFFAIASLLMFLSILTARCAEEDFLFSLPNKIIIGLGSLFIAIASMMVAFGSTLYIVLRERCQWVSFPIIILVGFPMTLFMILQLPLFIQMVISTYGGGVLHKKKLQEFKNKLE